MKYLKTVSFVILLIFLLPNNNLIKIQSSKSTPFQDPIPDYIFYNGTVITMEDSQPNATAVAVLDNKIIAVGNESDVFLYNDSTTEIINLKGRSIVPGFIDSHSHWIGDRGLTNLTEFHQVMDRLLEYGWTSISELFVNEYRLNELQNSDLAGELKVRVNCYLPLGYTYDRFGDYWKNYQPGHEYSSRLRIAGIKLFADGWLYNPTIFINQSEMNSFVTEAHALGYQIATHSVTPNATDIVLNAYESVIGTGSNDLRHRIEHLALLRTDQIAKLAELDILGCIQFSWFNSDWELEPDIGQDNAPYIGRWYELYEAGVHIMGSTDYPYVSNEISSPIDSITSVVTRIGTLGETPLDFMLNQTFTPEQALRSLTIDGAYGTFQENIKGSIKFGKLADLVMLSDNPLTVPVTDIKDIEVLMTMIDGEILYEKDETVTSSSSSSLESSSSELLTESTSQFSTPSVTTFSVTPFLLLIGIFFLRKRKKEK